MTEKKARIARALTPANVELVSLSDREKCLAAAVELLRGSINQMPLAAWSVTPATPPHTGQP